MWPKYRFILYRDFLVIPKNEFTSIDIRVTCTQFLKIVQHFTSNSLQCRRILGGRNLVRVLNTLWLAPSPPLFGKFQHGAFASKLDSTKTPALQATLQKTEEVVCLSQLKRKDLTTVRKLGKLSPPLDRDWYITDLIILSLSFFHKNICYFFLYPV